MGCTPEIQLSASVKAVNPLYAYITRRTFYSKLLRQRGTRTRKHVKLGGRHKLASLVRYPDSD
eukprot:scaffold387669_cov18-Prasinocladus_malaysianus.AAC.1